MKISTVLDHIDSGHIALPEFQRGYVWNRDQVRGLFDSLYRRHPVGGLLVWVTESRTASHRGDGVLAPGVVKMLLDGQQRMTSIYGVARGRAPRFFDGDSRAFTGLRFHLESESFEFHQPAKMRKDPLWIDVTELMKNGLAGHEALSGSLSEHPQIAVRAIFKYSGRISRVLGILDIELHQDEITGSDKTLDVVVDIFNRVNSGGTKLSKGDLALAKICAEWSDGRDAMKAKLREWEQAGYHFNLDWLLRSVNTVLTGEARFQFLHDKAAAEIRSGLDRASRHIDTCLNLIAGQLGLDHNRVFFGRYAVPVMARYLDQRPGGIDHRERDKLLFWFVQAAMWGRFSGSTESLIDQDLEALEGGAGAIDRLLKQLRLSQGSLRAIPEHFAGATRGARFFPVLYMLTRMGEARDWGTGLPLKAGLLGQRSHLDLHHIFPKAKLKRAAAHDFRKAEINALANFCFQTKDTNQRIADRLPEDYFPEIQRNHPGALASQWIPDDPALWKLDRFRDFLAARRTLLADALNRQMEGLLHGETHWLAGDVARAPEPEIVVAGSIDSEEEERELERLNDWVESRGLPRGALPFDHADEVSGRQIAAFDLAWPQGLQEELSQPVAVLLNEEASTIALASQAGYRCFTDSGSFRQYVREEVLGEKPIA